MAKLKNYDDDIFLISEQIRWLDAAFRLKPQTELFAEKMVQDLFFTEKSLDRLYTSLAPQKHLLGRDDLIRKLLRTHGDYRNLLDRILALEAGPVDLNLIRTRLRESRREMEERILALGGEFQPGSPESDNSEDHLSGTELSMLLGPDPE